MSVIATAVRHLMAAGVTGEALFAAIAELEAEVRGEPKARSAGAIRQERYRRNKASQTVTSDACDADPSLSRPLSPQTPLTPTHTHPDIIPARKGPSEEHVLAWQEWRKSNPFPRPWWVKSGLWRDFKANRKAKRLPNTASAHDKLLRDVDAMAARTGWPPGEVFAACVAKGWGAIYDPRETTNDRPKQRPSTARETTGETAFRIAAELSQGPGGGEASTYR